MYVTHYMKCEWSPHIWLSSPLNIHHYEQHLSRKNRFDIAAQNYKYSERVCFIQFNWAICLLVFVIIGFARRQLKT